MKRITTVLRESEAMAVRKAVCVAGGECVVITAIPQRLSPIELENCAASTFRPEGNARPARGNGGGQIL